jgi:polysaccharide export outer membrane protein
VSISFRCRASRGLLSIVLATCIAASGLPECGWAQSPRTKSSAEQVTPDTGQSPLMQIGPGDSLMISVYDQPDMTGTVYVSDDGTMPVALVGPVHVAGLSPAGAAQAIEKALRDGKYFKNPQVTITIVQGRSQRVSVLGEVVTPNIYPIDSKTTIFDLLAQAGGVRETASTTIYLLRADTDGHTTRYPIDLRILGDNPASVAIRSLQAGDKIIVPKAEEFYIYGEVTSPAKYRLEPNMTIVQAIVRAGGITARGSRNRIEVKRRGPDGAFTVFKGKQDDPVQPDDVIRVRESIF